MAHFHIFYVAWKESDSCLHLNWTRQKDIIEQSISKVDEQSETKSVSTAEERMINDGKRNIWSICWKKIIFKVAILPYYFKIFELFTLNIWFILCGCGYVHQVDSKSQPTKAINIGQALRIYVLLFLIVCIKPGHQQFDCKYVLVICGFVMWASNESRMVRLLSVWKLCWWEMMLMRISGVISSKSEPTLFEILYWYMQRAIIIMDSICNRLTMSCHIHREKEEESKRETLIRTNSRSSMSAGVKVFITSIPTSISCRFNWKRHLCQAIRLC